MNKKKRIIVGVVVAACIVLIGIACVYFFPYRTAKVDWNMHGYLVTADGEVKGELEFSVKGKIRDYKDKEEDDRLWLDFTFPDSFPYRIDRYSYPGYFTSPIQRYIDEPYYHCFCPASDLTSPWTETDTGFLHGAFALDPAKEYIIISFDSKDSHGQYLVASRDPDVTSEEILEYFQGFIDWYAFDKK